MVIWTDYQNVIDGFLKRPDWASRPRTLYRNVWSEHWVLIAENRGLRPRGISFRKVKAHATRTQRQQMGLAPFECSRSADQ